MLQRREVRKEELTVSNLVVNLNCRPILRKKGMVMHAEITAECLLAFKKYRSNYKDNEHQDPEVYASFVPCKTIFQSNTVSPNIISEFWLSNIFMGNVTPKSSASLTDGISFP